VGGGLNSSPLWLERRLASEAKAWIDGPSNGTTEVVPFPSLRVTRRHLLPIAKLTVLGSLALTVTDFCQLFGSVKMGRCTVCSVRTS